MSGSHSAVARPAPLLCFPVLSLAWPLAEHPPDESYRPPDLLPQPTHHLARPSLRLFHVYVTRLVRLIAAPRGLTSRVAEHVTESSSQLMTTAGVNKILPKSSSKETRFSFRGGQLWGPESTPRSPAESTHDHERSGAGSATRLTSRHTPTRSGLSVTTSHRATTAPVHVASADAAAHTVVCVYYLPVQ